MFNFLLLELILTLDIIIWVQVRFSGQFLLDSMVQ